MTLPTAYLPPLEYFRLLPEAQIEICENFSKRTLRNRALLTPSPCTVHQNNNRASCTVNRAPFTSPFRGLGGFHRASCISPLLLTIPVAKANSKQLTRDVRITYQLAWQQQHWHTIEALYRHTPYFQYFEDYLRPFYERQYTFLIDFNTLLNATILSLLQHERPTSPSPSHSHFPSPFPSPFPSHSHPHSPSTSPYLSPFRGSGGSPCIVHCASCIPPPLGGRGAHPYTSSWQGPLAFPWENDTSVLSYLFDH